jgi:hypothetical protein
VLQIRPFLIKGVRVDGLEYGLNEGRSWLSWRPKNLVQLTLLWTGWWKLDLLICTCVQTWCTYLCHVAFVELRMGIFLLNVLNHKALLIHYSAKQCQTQPQFVCKVFRKGTLRFVWIKFLAMQYATKISFFFFSIWETCYTIVRSLHNKRINSCLTHVHIIRWYIWYICAGSLSKLDVRVILGADCVAASEEAGKIVHTLNKYGITVCT